MKYMVGGVHHASHHSSSIWPQQCFSPSEPSVLFLNSPLMKLGQSQPTRRGTGSLSTRSAGSIHSLGSHQWRLYRPTGNCHLATWGYGAQESCGTVQGNGAAWVQKSLHRVSIQLKWHGYLSWVVDGTSNEPRLGRVASIHQSDSIGIHPGWRLDEILEDAAAVAGVFLTGESLSIWAHEKKLHWSPLPISIMASAHSRAVVRSRGIWISLSLLCCYGMQESVCCYPLNNLYRINT